MRRALDLTGQVFGRLTAIRPTEQRISGSVGWLCRCSCEEKNEIIAPASLLRAEKIRSCGCLLKESVQEKYIDITGQEFGRLTAIRPTEQRVNGNVVWLCCCSCDKKTEVVVSVNRLRSGNTRSCGCLKRDTRRESAIDLTGQVFGRLTVVCPTEQRFGSSVGWLCRCSCESQTEVVVSSQLLRSGTTRSCGCLQRELCTLNLAGQVFGRLTALRATDRRFNGSVGWLCRCSCEAQTEVVVPVGRLRSGGTRSCGCLKRERKKKGEVDV